MPSRIVVDTNVLISAILFANSKSDKAIRHARAVGIIISSVEVNEEYRRKIANGKFDRYVAFEKRIDVVEKFIGTIFDIPITKSIHACRDPEDDKILELAINGKADCIITGDTDLLVLSPFQGISILTPAQFLEKIF